MKKYWSVVLLAVSLISLVAEDAEAQRFRARNKYATVGVSLNAMNYFGDVVPQSDFTSLRFASTRPNLGVFYTRKFTPRISAKANLAWGRITGDDRLSASASEEENFYRNIRNLSFRNDITELSVVGVVDIFEHRGTYMRRPDFSPYVFLGVGVFYHNPKALAPNGEWVELQPLGTEGQNLDSEYGFNDPYSRVQISIPFGFGVRYKLDRHWDIGFEIGWRKTFTDYLDDVSGEYVDKSLLHNNPDSGPLAAIMSDRSADSEFINSVGINNPIFPVSQDALGYKNVKGYGTTGAIRGDKTDDDWFIVAGFNVSYILGSNIKSPKFR